MYRTILRFSNIEELIEFTLTIDACRCEIKKETFEISCTLNEIEIELAKSGFGASIVSMQKLASASKE